MRTIGGMVQRMEQGMVSREVKSGGRRVARRHEIHLLSLSALQNLGGILSLLWKVLLAYIEVFLSVLRFWRYSPRFIELVQYVNCTLLFSRRWSLMTEDPMSSSMNSSDCL